MSASFIKTFVQLSKSDVAIAGGKGASLGELTKAGIAVPPGFVILASAFNEFLENTPTLVDKQTVDLHTAILAELDRVNYADVNSVDRASNVIRALIHYGEFPMELKKHVMTAFKKLPEGAVAVRSSATAEDSKIASWAGELETYLNTNERNIFENIKKCWSSLYTPRAIFYRHEKNLLTTHVSVAVVVQKMIQSEVSGITFTVHPVTNDRNQMIIEAGWGLGEAIVSGSITPDSYILEKRKKGDPVILDMNVSEQKRQIVRSAPGVKWVSVLRAQQEKQKLTKQQIITLAKLCLTIEQHYKHPQDIEWALERTKFYILQSRPITTLT